MTQNIRTRKREATVANEKKKPEVLNAPSTGGTLFGLPIVEPLRHRRGQYPYPARLSEYHMRHLGASKTAKLYRKGTRFFEEGARPDGVVVIVNGLAKLSVNSAQGRAIVLGFFGAGTVMGLAATILGYTHVSTAETVEATTAVFVPRRKLLEELRTQPLAAWHAAQLVSEHNYFLMAKTANVDLSESAEQKIARCLLGLLSHDSQNGQALLKQNFSQETIAQMVGVSRETVSRLLSHLRREGVLDWKRSDFTIFNRGALEELADSPDSPRNLAAAEVAEGCSV